MTAPKTRVSERDRLVAWVGDNAPLSDSEPGAWTKFLGRLRSEMDALCDLAVDEYANRDRREEIADKVGDAEFEAGRG